MSLQNELVAITKVFEQISLTIRESLYSNYGLFLALEAKGVITRKEWDDGRLKAIGILDQHEAKLNEFLNSFMKDVDNEDRDGGN